MLFLKILFVLLLLAFIILLAFTVYNKFKNPDKSFINSMPFMDEFTLNEDADLKNVNDANEAVSENTGTTSHSTAAIESIATPVKNSSTPTGQPKNSPKTKATVSKSKKAAPKSSKPKAAKKVTKRTTKSKGDNIKKINGIGPVFEKKLNSVGINSFEHIAAWTATDIEKYDEQLELSGRPQREDWVAKAKILAAEKNA